MYYHCYYHTHTNIILTTTYLTAIYLPTRTYLPAIYVSVIDLPTHPSTGIHPQVPKDRAIAIEEEHPLFAQKMKNNDLGYLMDLNGT